jgi:hypothetical protein
MRFGPHSSPTDATRLLNYFRENAHAVLPQHRTVISSLLSEAAA